ncbi:MAG: hypothetical protein P8Y58_08290 [Novosphingobium sp.]
MQVKTLKLHGPPYGAKFWKEKDETYSLPDEQAKPLIDGKLIAKVKPAAQSGKAADP